MRLKWQWIRHEVRQEKEISTYRVPPWRSPETKRSNTPKNKVRRFKGDRKKAVNENSPKRNVMEQLEEAFIKHLWNEG